MLRSIETGALWHLCNVVCWRRSMMNTQHYVMTRKVLTKEIFDGMRRREISVEIKKHFGVILVILCNIHEATSRWMINENLSRGVRLRQRYHRETKLRFQNKVVSFVQLSIKQITLFHSASLRLHYSFICHDVNRYAAVPLTELRNLSIYSIFPRDASLHSTSHFAAAFLETFEGKITLLKHWNSSICECFSDISWIIDYYALIS